MRDDFQPIFRAANTRLAELPLERCREIELIALRAVPRPAGPRPPLLREVIQATRDAPLDEGLRDRAHGTLRRIYVALQREREEAASLQLALNAYLDGQGELGARWLGMDVMVRPWGEL